MSRDYDSGYKHVLGLQRAWDLMTLKELREMTYYYAATGYREANEAAVGMSHAMVKIIDQRQAVVR